MIKYYLFNSLFICLFTSYDLQSQEHKIATVAFYNLENLFDCENDKLIFDDDYTPQGKNNWTVGRLNTKLKKLAYVISEIGAKKTKQPPVLLGLAEVENRTVLEQLIDQTILSEIDYGIIHFDSPDRRGIDVALLYDRNLFKLINFEKHDLDLKNENNEKIYTRDQLCVSGYLGNELIYIVVCHWPSRRGGEKRSNPKRIEAAKLTKKITDSIFRVTKEANVIIMGDFNDNPTNDSFKKILSTKDDISKKHHENYLFNPMESMFKKGLGTLGYRDEWSLFDQIVVSESLVETNGWHFWNANIYNPKYLKQTKGRYKGYPLRTFSSQKYTEGYSDHFPVYIYLIKKVAE